MSLIIFFGGVSIVIILGLGVVVHGARHHYLEAQKIKMDRKKSI
jgi:hypothetical protein